MLKTGEKGAILQRDKETYAIAPLDSEGRGSGARTPRLADTLAEEERTSEQVMSLVDRLMDCYQQNAKKNERMGSMMDRISVDAVRSAVVS